jgi:hypothetical protein
MTDPKSTDHATHGSGNRNADDGVGSDKQKIDRSGKKEGWREDRDRVVPPGKERDRDNESDRSPSPMPIPPNPD